MHRLTHTSYLYNFEWLTLTHTMTCSHIEVMGLRTDVRVSERETPPPRNYVVALMASISTSVRVKVMRYSKVPQLG